MFQIIIHISSHDDCRDILFKDNLRAKVFGIKLEMHIQILGRGCHGNAQKMCFLHFLTKVSTLDYNMFINKSHINVLIPHLLSIILALYVGATGPEISNFSRFLRFASAVVMETAWGTP